MARELENWCYPLHMTAPLPLSSDEAEYMRYLASLDDFEVPLPLELKDTFWTHFPGWLMIHIEYCTWCLWRARVDEENMRRLARALHVVSDYIGLDAVLREHWRIDAVPEGYGARRELALRVGARAATYETSEFLPVVALRGDDGVVQHAMCTSLTPETPPVMADPEELFIVLTSDETNVESM